MAIKGTKSGIILVLDPDVPFVALEDEIALKFKEASSFFGKAKMGLIIRGRQLTSEEESKVLGIISDNSDISIVCIVDEDSPLENRFVEALKGSAKQQTEVVNETYEQPEAVDVINDNDAIIFSGNLRSGQDISSKKSIVVLGDVKPGANVTSYGSVFILGELRGNAFAGAGGDRDAVVMALDLNPLQVRIADSIAISPDAEKGPKLKVKRKRLLSNNVVEQEPEVAYIENGHIVKTLYGSTFLRQFYKL